MAEENQVNIVDEINYTKSLIDSLDTQLNGLLRGMEEIRRVQTILKDTEISGSRDRRISIGAGIFALGNIDTKSRMLVPVGSDVYIEEDPEKLSNRLDRNIADLQNSIGTLNTRRSDLVNRYEALLSVVNQARQEEQGKS
ncbi:MAG: prefoldin subunit alpha [Candidatus Thermoplasmatota archaeon]|nr:prefoldin subunit alpha [Candidatus Thermoplasmatota archaeon]